MGYAGGLRAPTANYAVLIPEVRVAGSNGVLLSG